ncbi:MAG: UDP-2,4-diacetamido-2,4,6-trideoxy-beta-L-altropyranose hydrolase [Halodesulfovibrio sp.]|uniref:UDP-2,4-diacetamido-2,4, 6-trideoxy-beta-L-altropyranose hydrolase n=1 Tax=Halodesulfovibrio sp. TaxID=1912772 RepID=UPI00359E3A02
MSELIVIRADATPSMGTGHVMRCLALVQAWERIGRKAVFVGHITVPWVRERLSKEGVSVNYLEGDVAPEQDVSVLLDEVSGYDASWVVLDGYHFSLECQKAVKNAGHRLLVIDDYNHLPEYCCDILLNQNINAPTIQYRGEIGTRLLGSDYVLLRQDIIKARHLSKECTPSPQIKNILLTLGGGDESHTFDQLKQVLHSAEMKGRTLRVIAGSVAVEKWNELLTDSPATVEIIQQAHDMSRHMLWADFCITAGGSTCWELGALKVPFVVFEVAENQKEIAQYFKNSSRGLGQLREIISGEIVPESIEIPVDGSGLVAGSMLLFPFSIMPVKSEHAEEIYPIVAAKETRRKFFSTSTFSLEHHLAWFEERLKKDEPFYVVMKDQSVAGFVRFDKDEADYVASIALAKNARGGGRGHNASMSTTECFFMRNPDAKLRAYIKKTNPVAIQLVLSTGFRLEGDVEGDSTTSSFYRLNGYAK